MQTHFTVSAKEMVRATQHQQHQHPGFIEMTVVAVMSGWSTIHVPHWAKSVGEFYWAVTH